jgi:hypothetical protein
VTGKFCVEASPGSCGDFLSFYNGYTIPSQIPYFPPNGTIDYTPTAQYRNMSNYGPKSFNAAMVVAVAGSDPFFNIQNGMAAVIGAALQNVSTMGGDLTDASAVALATRSIKGFNKMGYDITIAADGSRPSTSCLFVLGVPEGSPPGTPSTTGPCAVTSWEGNAVRTTVPVIFPQTGTDTLSSFLFPTSPEGGSLQVVLEEATSITVEWDVESHLQSAPLGQLSISISSVDTDYGYSNSHVTNTTSGVYSFVGLKPKMKFLVSGSITTEAVTSAQGCGIPGHK